MATNQQYRKALNPVMLELGVALFTCQLFESSLCFLLSMIESQKLKTEDAFTNAFDFHSKKMTGKLLDYLEKTVSLPKDDAAKLSAGVKKRNEIVHGFVTKRILDVVDPAKQIEVLKELQIARHDVYEANQLVRKYIDEILKTYVTSMEDFETSADKYFELANRNQSLLEH